MTEAAGRTADAVHGSEDPGAPVAGRSALGPIVVALAVVLAAVGLAVVPSIDLAASTVDTTAPTTTLVPDECSAAHAGHNVSMWSPAMADEMLDAGCPWPYEPFVTATEGGAENPNLAAVFEARRYDELWVALQEAGFGVCSVAALPDPPADGLAFGFRYEVRPGGCEGGDQVAELVVREHVTRAWRDARAGGLSAEGPVLVLGRWTLTAENATDFAANRLFETLVSLGAVTAGGPSA